MELKVNNNNNDVVKVDIPPITITSIRKEKKKLTVKKLNQVIRYLATQSFNLTAAGANIGVCRHTLYNELKTNESFQKAFDVIRDAYLDQIENVSVNVALLPSREGFNDRKLQLQSHRRKVYGDKQLVDISQTITIQNAEKITRSILAQNNPKKIAEAEYAVIDE